MLLRSEITADNGSFSISGLSDRDYLFVVDAEGYEPVERLITLRGSMDHKLDPVKLVNSATSLDEVIIEKKKPFAQFKIDRMIVNVDAMIGAAGSDAMDVLERSPGILIDENGVISYKGKSGLVVFIDDKPTYLSGSELEMYLKSLPAATLDQIEFMTNPPAKYEAAGSGGVINIKTRKSKIRGLNGSVSTRMAQGRRFHNRNGINLNYRDDKLRVYGSLGNALQQSRGELYIFRKFKNPDGSVKSLFHQDTELINTSGTWNARIGADFYASDRTTIGASVNGLYRNGNRISDGSSLLTDPMGVPDSTIVANNRARNKFQNGGLTLNYSHEFNEGRKLTADADYLKYNNRTRQRFLNTTYQPDQSLSSRDELRGYLPSDISIYALKADYTQPLKGESTLEAGAKTSYSATDNIAEYSDVVDGVPVVNLDNSNHFKYDEMINAAYLNYNYSFKRFSIQAGLRLEHTISKGRQLGNELKPASAFRRDYTNLFPTAYVMYKLDSIGSRQLVVNYGKRINRPYYEDLNPFVSPLDKYTYYSGNPYLNPSFSHNLEFSYRYKSVLDATISYSTTKDDINETIEISDGIYYSRPGNIGRNEYIGISVQSNLDPAKWFSINTYLSYNYAAFRSALYTQSLNTSGNFFSGSVTNRFKFKRGWSAELSGRYHTDIYSSQFIIGAQGTVNAGIQKQVLKDKGSIRLSANDVFYTGIVNGTINNLQLAEATWRNKVDSRFVAVTFSYSFGKTFDSGNSSDRSGAESEQNRVRG